jgi:hypothetical protein
MPIVVFDEGLTELLAESSGPCALAEHGLSVCGELASLFVMVLNSSC